MAWPIWTAEQYLERKLWLAAWLRDNHDEMAWRKQWGRRWRSMLHMKLGEKCVERLELRSRK